MQAVPFLGHFAYSAKALACHTWTWHVMHLTRSVRRFSTDPEAASQGARTSPYLLIA